MKILVVALLVSRATAMFSQHCFQSNTTKSRIIHHIGHSEVFAYPAIGGFVRKHVTAADLDWLGLKPEKLSDNSNETIPIASDKMQASNDGNEEDAFALRLMQLGGRWWPSKRLYKRHNNAQYLYGHHYPPSLHVGYTSKGVCVLRTWAGNSQYAEELPDVAPEKPDTWSRLSLCTTMEERCKVLLDFGANFYRSVEDCPDLPSVLEDGIARGEYYAELLRKMEDPIYLDHWLNDLSDIMIRYTWSLVDLIDLPSPWNQINTSHYLPPIVA